MKQVESYLAERDDEMTQHLTLLKSLDGRSLDGKASPTERIEVRQVLILKSSVLVHLYNIVEATMNRILDALADSVSAHHPKNYSDSFFEEWIRFAAKTNDGSGPDVLLKKVTKTGKQLIAENDWERLRIHRTFGNWDDVRIAQLAERLNVRMDIEAEVKRNASEHFRNDQSRLVYLREKRNQLAHGFETFEEGAKDRTSGDLADLAGKVLAYLKEVVRCFSAFDASRGYLAIGVQVA